MITGYICNPDLCGKSRGVLLTCVASLIVAIAMAPICLANDANYTGTLSVDFGEIDGVDGHERAVTIPGDGEMVVTRVVTSCECVRVRLDEGVELPVQVPEAGLRLTVTLDARSYEGAFRKLVYAQWRKGEERGMLEIPVTGRVKVDEEWETALAKAGFEQEAEPAEPKPVYELIPVTVETADAVLVLGPTVFVSPSCDMCTWLKLEWLPGAVGLGLPGRIYAVDITTDAGVKRLLALEETLGVAEAAGQAPAVLVAGEIVYGTEAISRLDVAAIVAKLKALESGAGDENEAPEGTGKTVDTPAAATADK